MTIRAAASIRWVVGIGAAALLGVGLLLLGIRNLPPRDDGVRVAPDNFAVANANSLPFSEPEGFEAELVAGPPLVKHPMFACFDDLGRLYVAGSSGHNLGAAQLLSDPPDVIRRLEDTDGDGRFDKSVVFADGLTYPQGVLWHDGAVFTASPPSLWRLEDTDGDGRADDRRELLTGFPLTGIADDLHGPSLGPDGRLYWGVGRFPYEIRRPGGPILRKGQAPLIMRCRTDGSEPEVVSSGLGNPVEVTFTPEGEPIACGTFFAPPSMGEAVRDAIIHCVRGGVFPVRDREHHEDRSTGELLPPLVHLGVAAPSGFMRARGKPLDGEEHLVLFSALFNMHKVQTHRLERDGATFRSRNDDFLVSDVADFHPTDVLEDADGSLLVVDTGGWFRSCPTSQIDKPDTFGAIYRLKRRDAAPPDDPRGLTLDWTSPGAETLVERLDDARFAVRDRAADRLVRLDADAVPALGALVREGTVPRARRDAVWTLARIDASAARAAIRPALDDADPMVRLAAITAAGLHRDGESLDRLIALAGEGEPAALRREAATALGRLGRPEGVAALLEGLRTTGDRFLDHAQIFALIEIDDRNATLPGLSDRQANVRRGALIALDQMRGGNLTPELVTPLLDPGEPLLEKAAIRVIASRPAWSRGFVEVLRPWLARNPLDAREREILQGMMPTISQDKAIQELVASALRDRTTPLETRLLLLREIGQAHLPHLPRLWLDSLQASLDDPNPRVVRQAVATIRTRGLTDFQERLIRLAGDPARSKDLRVEAFEATAPHVRQVAPGLFAFLCDRLRGNEPPLRRMAAARGLGAAPLDTGQLRTLCATVAKAGALVLVRLLPAYQRNGDYEVGAQLVSALSRAPGRRSLSSETLRQTFASYPAEIQAQIQPFLKQLDLRSADKAALLARYSSTLDQGVPDRGRDVFFGVKAACSTCHAVQGEGGRVGPDLTRIGGVRNGRDLLEAVLFPSASFARGYEPYLVATRDGQTLNALIAHESATEITFVTAGQGEIPLRRSAISTLKPIQDSIMPRGLEENMNPEELTDLLAFLRSLQ